MLRLPRSLPRWVVTTVSIGPSLRAHVFAFLHAGGISTLRSTNGSRQQSRALVCLQAPRQTKALSARRDFLPFQARLLPHVDSTWNRARELPSARFIPFCLLRCSLSCFGECPFGCLPRRLSLRKFIPRLLEGLVGSLLRTLHLAELILRLFDCCLKCRLLGGQLR
jgi:hypothetical protein